MGAPKIRRDLKEAVRLQRRAHQRLRTPNHAHVCIVQDENTKVVLAVLIDRNAFERFSQTSTLDLSHSELIDFPVII